MVCFNQGMKNCCIGQPAGSDARPYYRRRYEKNSGQKFGRCFSYGLLFLISTKKKGKREEREEKERGGGEGRKRKRGLQRTHI
jgi:hypothetical protein